MVSSLTVRQQEVVKLKWRHSFCVFAPAWRAVRAYAALVSLAQRKEQVHVCARRLWNCFPPRRNDVWPWRCQDVLQLSLRFIFGWSSALCFTFEKNAYAVKESLVKSLTQRLKDDGWRLSKRWIKWQQEVTGLFLSGTHSYSLYKY